MAWARQPSNRLGKSRFGAWELFYRNRTINDLNVSFYGIKPARRSRFGDKSSQASRALIEEVNEKVHTLAITAVISPPCLVAAMITHKQSLELIGCSAAETKTTTMISPNFRRKPHQMSNPSPNWNFEFIYLGKEIWRYLSFRTDQNKQLTVCLEQSIYSAISTITRALKEWERPKSLDMNTEAWAKDLFLLHRNGLSENIRLCPDSNNSIEVTDIKIKHPGMVEKALVTSDFKLVMTWIQLAERTTSRHHRRLRSSENLLEKMGLWIRLFCTAWSYLLRIPGCIDDSSRCPSLLPSSTPGLKRSVTLGGHTSRQTSWGQLCKFFRIPPVDYMRGIQNYDELAEKGSNISLKISGF